jgi:DNA repair protein RadC
MTTRTITLTINDSKATPATGHALTAPAAVYQACEHIKDLSQEHLILFTLNARHRVIGCHTVSIGTATASLVHPREVFRPALADNAAAVILAHNHPSGDTTPSPADRDVTQMIGKAGTLLGIELLDHLIVGADGFTSLRERHGCLFQA